MITNIPISMLLKKEMIAEAEACVKACRDVCCVEKQGKNTNYFNIANTFNLCTDNGFFFYNKMGFVRDRLYTLIKSINYSTTKLLYTYPVDLQFPKNKNWYVEYTPRLNSEERKIIKQILKAKREKQDTIEVKIQNKKEIKPFRNQVQEIKKDSKINKIDVDDAIRRIKVEQEKNLKKLVDEYERPIKIKREQKRKEEEYEEYIQELKQKIKEQTIKQREEQKRKEKEKRIKNRLLIQEQIIKQKQKEDERRKKYRLLKREQEKLDLLLEKEIREYNQCIENSKKELGCSSKEYQDLTLYNHVGGVINIEEFFIAQYDPLFDCDEPYIDCQNIKIEDWEMFLNNLEKEPTLEDVADIIGDMQREDDAIFNQLEKDNLI